MKYPVKINNKIKVNGVRYSHGKVLLPVVHETDNQNETSILEIKIVHLRQKNQ